MELCQVFGLKLCIKIEKKNKSNYFFFKDTNASIPIQPQPIGVIQQYPGQMQYIMVQQPQQVFPTQQPQIQQPPIQQPSGNENASKM